MAMGTGFSVSEYLSKEILGNGYAEEENMDRDEGNVASIGRTILHRLLAFAL